MKLIKVHSRMKLHEYGYPVALRFETSDDDHRRVKKWLEANYGSDGYWAGGGSRWRSHAGRAYWSSNQHGSREWKRTQYIGLRTEADALMVLIAT